MRPATTSSNGLFPASALVVLLGAVSVATGACSSKGAVLFGAGGSGGASTSGSSSHASSGAMGGASSSSASSATSTSTSASSTSTSSTSASSTSTSSTSTSSTSTSSSTSGSSSTSTSSSSTSSSSSSSGSSDPLTCADAATHKTSVGCDFWPTVVANGVWSVFDFAVNVVNPGSLTSTVTVTGGGGAATQVVNVAPGQLATIYLPWVPALKGGDSDSCGSIVSFSSTVRSNAGAYHLVATSPVAVYQYSALEVAGQGGPPGKVWSSCPGSATCVSSGTSIGCFSFTNDASLLLPTTALTGNYRVTTQAGWATESQGAYFAITGTQNGTSVTVTLPAAGGLAGDGASIPATAGGGTLALSLNAGDVVELVGTGTADNAGALVKASAPVQVISGMPCAYQPFNSANPACDHLEQSVLPAETLGKHYFVTAPTAPHGNVVGHIVRMIGNANGTTLSYSPSQPVGAPTTLAAGQVVDLGQIAQDFEVQGNHEFAVVDFMLSGSLLDPNAPTGMQLGDPSQSDVIPVEQYRVEYAFAAPTNYSPSFVDIVMPMTATVNLDGAALTATPTAIGSGYGIARQPLAAGSNNGLHTLVSSAPVGIQVIGYAVYTSYMYPGGTNLAPIAPPPM